MGGVAAGGVASLQVIDRSSEACSYGNMQRCARGVWLAAVFCSLAVGQGNAKTAAREFQSRFCHGSWVL